MRQKYVLSRDGTQKTLTIMEYAITERHQKNAASAMLAKGEFSFLCEETYESEMIATAVSKGTEDLVATLRTRNMFPIRPFAVKIAESVTALYESDEDGSVELFFDDIDSMPT